MVKATGARWPRSGRSGGVFLFLRFLREETGQFEKHGYVQLKTVYKNNELALIVNYDITKT